ncbi:sucrose nonfermenting 4-like protein [Heracleum sosnowskyi]|uniref:Sucrose nonfermenting 4-like protein n=1 Tax=Heracleum sosnowskyi TaxID=360622 RepID=A0AAD8HBA3_9APIA|nr:sucrose nonfermenting 4-like protein [Heracleum sosnowskyi]
MVQVEFVWCYGGTQVFLYDSFSGWSEGMPMSLIEGSSTVFTAVRDLPPGRHQFKFLVDNVWRIDDRLSFRQDNTYGTISNFILVTEQGLITPIIESFTPSMVIANEIPQPILEVSSSSAVQQGPVLSLPVSDMYATRLHLSMHMSSYTTYDLLPESSEVIALDVNMDVEEAFSVMYRKGLAVLPIWDAPSRRISGMLTASDFIFILLKIHQRRAVLTNVMHEMRTISTLKEGKLEFRREGASSSSLAYRSLVQAGPDESLLDLAHRIVQYRISAVPILDSAEDGSCPKLLHVACLGGILKHICRHLGDRLEYLPLLQQPVGSLRLGTWRADGGSSGPFLLTLRPRELLGYALHLFIEAQISAVPIVDDEGALLNVFSRSDITSLTNGSVHAQIQLDQRTIAEALALVDGGAHNRYQICEPSDSLHKVMELLSDPVVRRIIVINSDNKHVEGIITLRDVFTFLLS